MDRFGDPRKAIWSQPVRINYVTDVYERIVSVNIHSIFQRVKRVVHELSQWITRDVQCMQLVQAVKKQFKLSSVSSGILHSCTWPHVAAAIDVDKSQYRVPLSFIFFN